MLRNCRRLVRLPSIVKPGKFIYTVVRYWLAITVVVVLIYLIPRTVFRLKIYRWVYYIIYSTNFEIYKQWIDGLNYRGGKTLMLVSPVLGGQLNLAVRSPAGSLQFSPPYVGTFPLEPFDATRFLLPPPVACPTDGEYRFPPRRYHHHQWIRGRTPFLHRHRRRYRPRHHHLRFRLHRWWVERFFCASYELHSQPGQSVFEMENWRWWYPHRAKRLKHILLNRVELLNNKEVLTHTH